jgi:glutamyl-tRNA reductase
MVRAAGGRAVDLEAVDGLMATVDVMICSSAASRAMFDRARVDAWQSSREHQPLLVIDIAVPRDVDPAAAEVPGVSLFNIDDLREIAERNLARREEAIPAAERIVGEELRRTVAALDAREVAPAVRALIKRVEGLRDQELDRQLARLPEDDAISREALRHLATALTAKFLHAPITRLRDSPQPRVDAALLADAFAVIPEDAADG